MVNLQLLNKKRTTHKYLHLFLFLLFIIQLVKSVTIIDIFPGDLLKQKISDLGGESQIEQGTIFQFHSGIHKDNQYTNGLKGNSTHHIKILGENNVILEMSLYLVNCEYIDLIGPFEIRNSPPESYWSGNALTVDMSDNILVTGFHIHHAYHNGMAIMGNNNIIKNNYIHDCVYMNYKHNGTGWGQSMRIGKKYNDTIIGTNNLVENNIVTESWGEGIDLLYCDNCIARNNTIRNTFGTMMYMDNSRNIIIENNFIFCTTDEFNDGSIRSVGIGIGTEGHGNISATNITIRNNLILSTHHGVQHIGLGGYYSDIKMVHNTFYNVTALGMQFPGSEQHQLVKNNLIANNLFSGGYNYKNEDEKLSWTVFSNGWISEKKVENPLWDTIGNNSFRIRKNMSEVIFPKAKNGCLEIECFLPRCLDTIPLDDEYGNLLIGKGEYTEYSNGVDFFGRKRNITNPTLGFSELCVLPDDWKKKEEKKGTNTGLIIFLIILSIIIIGGVGFIIYWKFIKKGRFVSSFPFLIEN